MSDNGSKAILYLLNKNGAKLSEEEAKKVWCRMSEYNQKTIMTVYQDELKGDAGGQRT